MRNEDFLLSERQVNIYTGKALVGALTQDEQVALTQHLASLYHKMDLMDDEDYFGTEGWRHYFGIPDDE